MSYEDNSNSNSIDLDIEDSNELLFKVRIEGTDPAPAKVRLVCESENGDLSYMFNGHSLNEDDLVQFMIPNMNHKLKEGMYKGRIEVLVENRYFTPVEFGINFKKTMKVVAEAVNYSTIIRKPQETSVKVSALPIVVPKQPKQNTIPQQLPTQKPQEIQQPKRTQVTSVPQNPIKKVLNSESNKSLEISLDKEKDKTESIQNIAKRFVNEMFEKQKQNRK